MSDLQDIANILNIDNSENIEEKELVIETMTFLCKRHDFNQVRRI